MVARLRGHGIKFLGDLRVGQQLLQLLRAHLLQNCGQIYLLHNLHLLGHWFLQHCDGKHFDFRFNLLLSPYWFRKARRVYGELSVQPVLGVFVQIASVHHLCCLSFNN